MKSPFRDRLLLAAFLVILLAFGALVARKVLLSRPPSAPPPASAEAPQNLRDIVLYFGAPDGSHLMAEGREIDCLEEVDCVRETVQALVDGPVGDLVPVVPSHAVVRDVRVEDGTVVVDFSRELVNDHPGGSLSELFTVYGLANSVASNFPHLKQVRILVEGEAVESLKGHVALMEPVPADFRFGRPPEGVGAETPPDGEAGHPEQEAETPPQKEEK